MAATGAQEKAIVDAATSWWHDHRPKGMTADEHVADPTVGIEFPLHRLARAVAARVGHRIQRPPSEAPGAKENSLQPELDDTTMTCRGKCGRTMEISDDTFPFRPDRPNRRHTICVDCRRQRQRNRYLSVAMSDALDEVRLEFVIDESDATAQLRCTACERPFRSGEKAVADAELRHVVCPTLG